MRKLLYCLIIVNLVVTSILASNYHPDTTIKSQSVGIKYYSGILQYHHKEMRVLNAKPANALELSIILVGNGSKLWHSFYGYPSFGLSYKFMDLGNPSILGYSHSLSPFINIPFVSSSSNFKLGLHVGSGLSYISIIFNSDLNPDNLAISTHVNAYINLGITLDYFVTNNFTINAGFHLSHFSNGTFTKPNYGLNYTLFSLGAQYTLKHDKIQNSGFISPAKRDNRLLILGLGSLKEIKGVGGPQYGVWALSVEYSRPIKPLLRYGFSLDLMHDESNRYTLNYNDISWDKQWELHKSGITFNTEFVFDRLSAVLYFGGYVYNKARVIENEYVYQRLGLRYRISDSIWIHLALKTHWNKADYIELGAAVRVF